MTSPLEAAIILQLPKGSLEMRVIFLQVHCHVGSATKNNLFFGGIISHKHLIAGTMTM